MKSISLKLVSIIILMLTVLSNFAFGQSAPTDDESKIHINVIRMNGGHIFAGTTDNGVYRSVDGGKYGPL